MMRDRFVRLDLRFAFDSFGRYLECPRKNQRHWKTRDQQQHNQPHRPVWDFKERKDLRGDLDEQPRSNCVVDRNLVDVASFQLGEEVQQVHGLAFAKFCKRESLRTPSHAASKRKMAAVVPFGFESESCSNGNAFSRSPSTAYPRAASYSERGRIQ